VRARAAINKDIAALFPKDSDFGNTNALDAVWTKNDEFRKRARVARDKSDALYRIVESRDIKNYEPRLKELIEACKSCHEDFRKEEQSARAAGARPADPGRDTGRGPGVRRWQAGRSGTAGR
jgi:hypothetical protein